MVAITRSHARALGAAAGGSILAPTRTSPPRVTKKTRKPRQPRAVQSIEEPGYDKALEECKRLRLKRSGSRKDLETRIARYGSLGWAKASKKALVTECSRRDLDCSDKDEVDRCELRRRLIDFEVAMFRQHCQPLAAVRFDNDTVQTGSISADGSFISAPTSRPPAAAASRTQDLPSSPPPPNDVQTSLSGTNTPVAPANLRGSSASPHGAAATVRSTSTPPSARAQSLFGLTPPPSSWRPGDIAALQRSKSLSPNAGAVDSGLLVPSVSVQRQQRTTPTPSPPPTRAPQTPATATPASQRSSPDTPDDIPRATKEDWQDHGHWHAEARLTAAPLLTLKLRDNSSSRVTVRNANVKGDGNCLYRAFSVAYFGTEKKWRKVRRTARLMFANAFVPGSEEAASRGSWYSALNELNLDGREQEQLMLLDSPQLCVYADDSRPLNLAAQLEAGNAWGTTELVQVLADAYGVDVLLWSAGQPARDESRSALRADLTVRGERGRPQVWLMNWMYMGHWTALAPVTAAGAGGAERRGAEWRYPALAEMERDGPAELRKPLPFATNFYGTPEMAGSWPGPVGRSFSPPARKT